MVDTPRISDLHSPHRPRLRDSHVESALRLVADRVGPFEYLVSGGREDHYVALFPYFECDCGSFVFAHETAPVVCKHLICALAAHGDPEALEAMARVRAEVARRPPKPPKARHVVRTRTTRRPSAAPVAAPERGKSAAPATIRVGDDRSPPDATPCDGCRSASTPD